MSLRHVSEFVVYPARYNPDKDQYHCYRILKSATARANKLGIGSEIWGIYGTKNGSYNFDPLVRLTKAGWKQLS